MATVAPTDKDFSYLPTRLQNGDRLTLSEFKQLYANSPKIRRAELIEGVVYVASPVYLPHSTAQAQIITLLSVYHGQTPNTKVVGEQSVQLDNDNEVQPDALLWYEGDVEEIGGLLVGSPTLVVEVAVSTRAYDLGVKKQVYRRNKVQEYLVLAAHEQEIFWHRWQNGAYTLIQPNENGIYKSVAFLGLWLDSKAFWAQDTQKLLSTLNLGIQTR